MTLQPSYGVDARNSGWPGPSHLTTRVLYGVED
jgi:hypothetical protein